ncbi:hypothetical protein D7Z54_15305 [Salibacterium salarium]|uniref:Uncharacterized protein n=2 Tax=Salibacterium salarium TaxID=284579 RepID=A0A428N2G0_9BACI|nr:hypothetical protein D7Z54_15305 [Salibacterium salarium]
MVMTPTFLCIIVIPSVISIVTMATLLPLKWMLEKEVNNKKSFFPFHIINVILIMMMCGTSSVVFHGFMLDAINEKGWGIVSLYAYVYPLPIVLVSYISAAKIFQTSIQPYRISKHSNVIYLKTRRIR